MTNMIGTLTSRSVDINAAQAQAQTATLNGKIAGAKAVTMQRIEAVAQDFEAAFVAQMMSSMFSTVDKTESKDALGGSDAEDTYQSLMVQEYGKVIARNGGIGLADQIKQSMLRLQEVEGGLNAPVPTPAA